MTLVILAGQSDPAARVLAARWSEAGQSSRVLTCADLSSPGWVVSTRSHGSAAAVLGGEVIPATRLSGVLVRLPVVSETEVPHIAPEDRGYVAAEMHAFLMYWLSTLSCRVINRPTTRGFGGPALTREEWVLQAERLDIPSRPVQRYAHMGSPQEPVLKARPTVSVVGPRCIGNCHPVLGERAQRLAADSGASVLAVHFDGTGPDARFLDADPWVNVWDPSIGDALLECFLEGAAC